jgi:hypothetical protein
VTSPATALLRSTYNLSTGVKNFTSGRKDHGQRYRYPRFFDPDDLMPTYDLLKAHASTALKSIKQGKYANQHLVFERDLSTYKNEGNIKERILFITKEHLFFVKRRTKLVKVVQLKKIKGMMLYFYDQKGNGNLILELD